MRLDAAPETPAALTLGLEPLVASARTGIVSDLRIHRDDVDDAAGVVSVSGRLAGGSAVAGSSAFDAEAARVRAIGEAIERYALLAAARWVRTASASWRDVCDRALDPRRLALPTARERDEHPTFSAFDPDAPIAWVEGHRLLRDARTEPCLLPAQAALAHHACPPPERRFVWASSSGAGAGNTLAEALRSGLREVLERDAFATTWLRRRAPPHVDLDRVRDADVARWRDHHRARGRTPSVAWLTNDLGYPVLMAQVVEGGPIHYASGFGAGLDPRRAMRRAVEECEQGRYLLKHLLRQNAPIPAEAPTLEAQILYWQRPDRQDALRFLTAGDDVLDPDALRDLSTGAPLGDVQRTLALLAAQGLEAFALDLTPPDLRHLPVKVVGALVPGAQPVRMGAKPWCLANPRLGGAADGLHVAPPPFA